LTRTYLIGFGVSRALLMPVLFSFVFFRLVDGRLEKELQYTKDVVGEGSGTTNELLIHKSNSGLGNILSVGLLQQHLEKVQKAIDVKVTLYNK